MPKSIDSGLPLLMLGCAVLGFVLATAVVKKEYALRMEQQRIDYQLEKAKAHMTTVLQLNECHINEAFYSLDREIFEIKKNLESARLSAPENDYATPAINTIVDYYSRFTMLNTCDECVPSSPLPKILCTRAELDSLITRHFFVSKPTISLLPGFHGSTGLFGPLIRELGKNVQTRTLGFTSHRSIADHAESLSRDLPKAGAFLLAESFSTLIALELAARHPQRFRGLSLSTPFARTPLPLLAQLGAILPLFCFRRSPIRKFVLNYFCLNEVADKRIKTAVLTAINDVPALTVKRRIEVLSKTNLLSALPAIKTPCLLLESTQDRVVSRGRIDELERHLPNTERVRIAGPHLILQANPGACAAAIGEFINSV